MPILEMKAMRARVLLLFVLLLVAGASWPASLNADETKGSEQHAQSQLGSSEKSPVVVQILPPSESERKAADEREMRKEKADQSMVNLTQNISSYTQKLSNYTADLSRYTLLLFAVGLFQLLVFTYQGVQLRRTMESFERSERLNRPGIPGDSIS